MSENDMPLENEAESELYKIDQVAKMLGIHQQTLRNWERKELVKPLRAGGARIYTAAHVVVCRKIKKYSGKGVPLCGIRELI